SARARLIALLRLEVVEDLRQVAVRAQDPRHMEGHALLMRHREHEVGAAPVLQLEELVDVVAPGLPPQLGRQHHRHQHLLAADGMTPFLMVGPPAPAWATTGPTKKYIGVWKTDPKEYGRFVRAIGRRYSGTMGLPRVGMWSVWNEPNHPQFIQPLSERIGGKR